MLHKCSVASVQADLILLRLENEQAPFLLFFKVDLFEEEKGAPSFLPG